MHQFPEAEDLARLVARAFYAEETVIVLEALIRERLIKDDDLAQKLKLHQKQVRRVLLQLKGDHFVGTVQRNEPAAATQQQYPQAQRAQHLSLWFIDYRKLIHAVKYRLLRMQRQVIDEIDHEIDDYIYRCPLSSCAQSYTALDAQRLNDNTSSMFRCEYCGTEVQEIDTSSARLSRAQGQHQAMASQLRRIFDQLKLTEKLVLPANPIPVIASSRTTLQAGNVNGMAVVGSSSSAVLFPSSSFNSKLEPGGSVHRGQSSELNIVIDLELKTTPSYTAPSAASIEHSSMSAARGSQKPDSSVSIPWLRVSQDNKPKVHEDTKPVKMEQQKAGGASNDASSVYYDQYYKQYLSQYAQQQMNGQQEGQLSQNGATVSSQELKSDAEADSMNEFADADGVDWDEPLVLSELGKRKEPEPETFSDDEFSNI